MQPLEYQTRRKRTARGELRAALVEMTLALLPVAAAAITAVVFFQFAHGEPFMRFTIESAAFQLGGPLLVTAMWVLWFWLAWRKHRLPPGVLALAACWAACNVWVAQWLFVSYLKEPWNG